MCALTNTRARALTPVTHTRTHTHTGALTVHGAAPRRRLPSAHELAFAMALHARLGAAGPGRALVDALARHILEGPCSSAVPRVVEL
jgi:hypothetical protein